MGRDFWVSRKSAVFQKHRILLTVFFTIGYISVSHSSVSVLLAVTSVLLAVISVLMAVISVLAVTVTSGAVNAVIGGGGGSRT